MKNRKTICWVCGKGSYFKDDDKFIPAVTWTTLRICRKCDAKIIREKPPEGTTGMEQYPATYANLERK